MLRLKWDTTQLKPQHNYQKASKQDSRLRLYPKSPETPTLRLRPVAAKSLPCPGPLVPRGLTPKVTGELPPSCFFFSKILFQSRDKDKGALEGQKRPFHRGVAGQRKEATLSFPLETQRFRGVRKKCVHWRRKKKFFLTPKRARRRARTHTHGHKLNP